MFVYSNLFFLSQLYGYHAFGHAYPLDGNNLSGQSYYVNISLLMLAGLLVNGPYALITTAVSAELGVHPSLQGKLSKVASFLKASIIFYKEKTGGKIKSVHHQNSVLGGFFFIFSMRKMYSILNQKFFTS